MLREYHQGEQSLKLAVEAVKEERFDGCRLEFDDGLEKRTKFFDIQVVEYIWEGHNALIF